MAERRAEESAPPASGQRTPPASGQLTEQINRAYASSAPVLPDEPAGRHAHPGPRPETAARFAAAMSAVDQTQAAPRPAAPAPAGAPAPVPGAPSAAAAASTGAPVAPSPGVRRPRRARLRLTHIDPWSVMKTALLLSIAVGIVTVVAVAVLWAVLNAAGVWSSIDKTVAEVVGTQASGDFRIEDYVGTGRVLGFTMLVAAVDVVLITVIATLGAFLYNLAAALLGGLEVVLAEDD